MEEYELKRKRDVEEYELKRKREMLLANQMAEEASLKCQVLDEEIDRSKKLAIFSNGIFWPLW